MAIHILNQVIKHQDESQRSFSSNAYAFGSRIAACIANPIRILSNIPLTIAENALPDVYERLFLGAVLSFGKEAILKGGTQCIVLTALQGIFGNIDTRYETYWKSKTWIDLISSDYLQSICHNASLIINEPKELGPILNKTSAFISNAVGNLFSDPSSYCTDEFCPNNSTSVKVAAFFTALYFIFASVRITHAIGTGICADIHKTYFPSKPVTQEPNTDLLEEVKALAKELNEVKNFKQELLDKLEDVNTAVDDSEELEDEGTYDCEEVDDVEEMDDCEELEDDSVEEDSKAEPFVLQINPSYPLGRVVNSAMCGSR